MNEENETLLEFINDRGLKTEKELMINILEKIKNKREDVKTQDDLEWQLIHQVKLASDTSPGLVETMESIRSRFIWPWRRVVIYTSISISTTIATIGSYFFDVYTDIIFR